MVNAVRRAPNTGMHSNLRSGWRLLVLTVVEVFKSEKRNTPNKQEPVNVRDPLLMERRVSHDSPWSV